MSLIQHYQKLNDSGRHWFWFRGSIGPSWNRIWFRYEIASGPALKLTYQHGESCDSDASSQICLGLIFFTAYITFWLPKRFYFTRKCIATWNDNSVFYLVQGRRYGFYFYHWSLVWHFHAKVNESSSRDPWWMHQYWHLDQWLFGKWEALTDSLASVENVKFKLGDKVFTMDSISWERRRRFRRFIPYSLFHQTSYGVNMKIERPPLRAGKGENSWDLGGDGAYGMSAPWPHKPPSYFGKGLDEAAKQAVDIYVDSLRRDVRKYGSGSGPYGVSRNDSYEYIGRNVEYGESNSEATQ